MRNLRHLFTTSVWRNYATGIRRWKFVQPALLLSGTTFTLSWFLLNRNIESSDHSSNTATSTSSISQPSTSLCQLCRSVSLPEIRSDLMQLHQPSYLALKKSASGGCQLCEFIWRALKLCEVVDPLAGEISKGRLALSHVSEQYPGRQISLVAWGNDSDGWLDRILITTTGEVPDVESDQEGASSSTDPTMHPDHQIALSGVLDLFAHPDDPAAWLGEIRGRPLPTTAGDSDEDFELAKRWLNDCFCSHDYCRKASPRETRLPTRVLDIGPVDGFEQPYLLETRGMHGCYIALSHCWGGQVPLTTTFGTISQRKRCISLPSLPGTFRDAVLISRKLGVRYLWIDSLCIIQDSKIDWEKESAAMGDVYGQSYLTIAARGAANTEIGCFIPRKEELPTCCLEYRNGSIKGKMYIRDPAFKTERIDQSPLDERGWIFQERILSPRILYYGSQQLYWECTSITIRQDGKYRDVNNDGFRSWDGFKQCWDPDAAIRPHFKNDEDKKSLQLSGISMELFERMRYWYQITHQYTRRKLTFDSDRLPAIAGVAKQFHRKTGYLYVAGLWKEDLKAGLLWYRVNAKDAPTSSKLPTWSWARFSGEVRFWCDSPGGLEFLDTECELIDLSYHTTDSLQNYGEISNARIQIKGRVVRGILKQPAAGPHLSEMMLYTKGGGIVGRPKFDRPDSHKVGFEFFCLLVHQGLCYSDGLVLEQVEGQTAEYKRIGYIRISNDRSQNTRIAFSDINPQVLTII